MMNLLRRIGLLLCGLVLMAGLTTTQAQGEDGVSAVRIDRLARGINMTTWFYLGPTAARDIRERVTDAELALLAEMGFTYVRVPIGMQLFFDHTNPGQPYADRLELLDEAIERMMNAGLGVVIDMHGVTVQRMGARYGGGLEISDRFVDVFIEFWQGLAMHLSQYDPDWVFFEVFNEPVFNDNPERWEAILPRLAEAVRAQAPEHTLIVSGINWANINGLLRLQPLPDPNVLYNFHFYEPFLFTHQAATWPDDGVVAIARNVPYPVDPDIIAPVLAEATDPALRERLAWYAGERWNRERIEQSILRAVAWGEQHGVRLVCTEFGVHYVVNDEVRARWHQDVREVLEEHGIGWALWDYDKNFGLVVRQGGGRVVINEPVALALGLTLPQ